MVNKITNKLTIGFLIFFSVFGIFFFSIMAHEVLHVIHADNHAAGAAKSICIDMNLKTADSVQDGYLAAHTSFDDTKWQNVEEFNTWRELSEKYASYLEYFLIIILAFIMGLIVSKFK